MAEEDLEQLSPSKIEAKTTGTVFPSVGVACFGAILFGYHLGYAFLYSLRLSAVYVSNIFILCLLK